MIVDVCKAYWTPGSPLDISSNPAAFLAPDSIRRLVAAARAGKVPVIWIQSRYLSPGMKDAGLFVKKARMLNVWQEGDQRGLDGYVEGLVPERGDTIVHKKFESAFFGTTLVSELQGLKTDTLVICGVSTSGGVRATTLDAMQNGYRPMVNNTALLDVVLLTGLRSLPLRVEIAHRTFKMRISSTLAQSTQTLLRKRKPRRSSLLAGVAKLVGHRGR